MGKLKFTWVKLFNIASYIHGLPNSELSKSHNLVKELLENPIAKPTIKAGSAN